MLTPWALVLLQLTLLFGGGLNDHNWTLLVAADDWSTTSMCAAIVVGTGYPCIEHTVQTNDGYVLGLQNIPYGLQNSGDNSNRPPVFLQHGLLQDGDDWVLNSPEEALAYLLADAGFDVWIGNTRNTRWSHGHISFTKDSQEYWDWTWDELSAYDLTSSLAYVYQMTNNTKLRYVGHSMGANLLLSKSLHYQGTLTMLAALSDPGSVVSEMVRAVALLSPIAYVGNVSSALVQVAAKLYIDKIFQDFGLAEFSANNAVGLELIALACATSGVGCGELLSTITGFNCCLNTSRIDYYLLFEPQPTSLKNMVHVAQMVRTGTLAKYDYGEDGNMAKYNQPTAPTYEVSQIDKSIAMFIAYGGNDAIGDPQDIAGRLLPALSPDRVLEVLYLSDYAHMDFLLGNTAYMDLYPRIISFFQTLPNWSESNSTQSQGELRV